MKNYNKLVRDKIPLIIELDNKKVVYHKLNDEEYLAELEKKLDEEVSEYQKDKNLEKMADILEVLYAICETRGYSLDKLEAMRKEKAVARGGFKDKIFLKYVEE